MNELEKSYAKHIAEEYAPKTASKVVRLKKLDDKVKRPAKTLAWVLGAIGALIAGSGMSMIMSEFGFDGQLGMIVGIVLGVVGFIVCGINYPIYVKFLNARKEKYAYEIIELAKEIEEE